MNSQQYRVAKESEAMVDIDIEERETRNQIFHSSKPLLNERISQSYPPDTKRNHRYSARIHSILENLDLSQIQESHLTFRQLQTESDIAQLKELHEEWFPINYRDNFYSGLLNRSPSSFSIIVEVDLSVFGISEKYMIAAMLYEKRETKFSEMSFKFADLFRNSYCLYIQTIGVINEFRGHGIASKFIEYLRNQVHQCPHTRYISLHMVTYNISGEKFYFKNGFKKVSVEHDFYVIEGRQYGAFVFCLYVKDSSQPIEIIKCLKGKLLSCFRSEPSLQSEVKQI